MKVKRIVTLEAARQMVELKKNQFKKQGVIPTPEQVMETIKVYHQKQEEALFQGKAIGLVGGVGILIIVKFFWKKYNDYCYTFYFTKGKDFSPRLASFMFKPSNLTKKKLKILAKTGVGLGGFEDRSDVQVELARYSTINRLKSWLESDD